MSTLDASHASPGVPRHRGERALSAAAILLALYLLFAYVLMPGFWRGFVHRHPAIRDLPGITHTKTGIPGDPINVALIGTQHEVMQIMVAAKWYPADPLTMRSCLEIAGATVLKRPYETAPVSNLFLWGRKQDLAFEQPVGNNPRRRHHVRFWRSEKTDADGRPFWAGAAIYDERVEISRTTGQVTHRTDGDIDKERDYLFNDIERTGKLSQTSVVGAFHKVLTGRNGGGDRWHTDGKLFVGRIGASDGRQNRQNR